MATAYMMTPAERREQAQKLREEREARWGRTSTTPSATVHQRSAYPQQAAGAAQEEQPTGISRTLETVGRVGATAADIPAQAVFGVAEGIEGIADLGIGLVGALGGVFDADFQDGTQKIIAYDAVKNWMEEPMQGVLEKSYLNDSEVGNFIRQIPRAVGGMLPSILVSAVATPAAGLAVMGTGAAGSATEEAYQEGADYYQGLAYGAASGAVEVATEKLSGGIGKFFGGGLLDDVGKSIGKEVADQGAKRVIKGMAGEAAEEAIASAVNPALKTIYKGKDALSEYKDPAFYGEIGQSAALGALTSGALGVVTKTAGKSGDISASLDSINKLKQQQGDLFAQGALTDTVQNTIYETTKKNLQNIETTLQKASSKQRATLIEKHQLGNLFTEDGQIRPEAAARLVGDQVNTQDPNTADRRYLSPSMWNQRETVTNELQSITKDLRTANPSAQIQDVKVFAGEIPLSAQPAYTQFKRAVATISNKTQTGLNFVLVDKNDYFTGAINTDGNTLYLSEEALEDGTWAAKLVHETVHFAEGSESYAKLIDYLKKDTKRYQEVASRLVGEGNAYGFSAELLDRVTEKIEKKQTLNGEEIRFASELNASLAEEVLGNEAFIERLIRQDTSLAERIIAKIKDLLEAFRTLGNKEARAQYRRLKKAEGLFMQAVENAGYKYVAGKLRNVYEGEEEQNEDVENEHAESVQFSLNTENYQKRIEAWDGKTEGFSFVVGETPLYLSQLEIDGKKIGKRQVRIDATKIKKIISEHPEMTVDVFKELPYLLKDPILVLDSKTVKGRLILLGEVYAAGNPVMMALEINPTTRSGNATYVDIIKIASAYTRKNTQNLINSSNIRYISENKNRVDNWLKVNRLQLPLPNSQLNSATISIPHNSQNVNTSEEKNQFSLKPKDPFTAAVVEGVEAEFAKRNTRNEKNVKAKSTEADEELRQANEERRNFNYTNEKSVKKSANENRSKVYTKKDADAIVSEVLANHMSFGEVYGDLRGKSRQQIVDMLWRGLNTAEPGKRGKVALDIAEYILKTAFVEDSVMDPATDETYRERLNLLKRYVHKMDLSEIKGEIRYRYDKKAAGVFARWGKRKGTIGLTPDVVAPELESLGFPIEATNPADILFEMDTAYQNAVNFLNKQAKVKLKDTLTTEEERALKQEIAREILNGFAEKGSPSKLAKTVNDYTERIDSLKGALREEKGRNTIEGRLLDSLQKLKDLKLGTYHRASEFNDVRFRGSVEKLTSIQYRGVLRQKATRGIVHMLLDWYTPQNELLKTDGVYREEVRDMMAEIVNGEGELTNNDLKLLTDIVNYFRHFVETYNKVYRNGKYVDADVEAKRYVELADQARTLKVGAMSVLMNSGYARSFADPVTLMRFADKYNPKGGFFTEIFEEFRQASIKYNVMRMELLENYNQFFDTNKHYAKQLQEHMVTYQDREIPLTLAIALYMTSKRKQAWRGLVKAGVQMKLDKERVRFMELVGADAKPTDAEIEHMAHDLGESLYKQFSKTDKAFIKVMEDLLDRCKTIKKETDMIRLGYSNVTDDYYFPIIRAIIAKTLDKQTYRELVDHVNNLSINKKTVEKAAGELYILPVTEIIESHVDAVSKYATISYPVDNFQRLYNLDIGDNPNKPISIETAIKRSDEGEKAIKYLMQLTDDVQKVYSGANTPEGYQKASQFIRKGYIIERLAFNPKTLLSQLSSLFAATNILHKSSVMEGMLISNRKIKVDGKTVDEVDHYCKLAKLRNYEPTVIKAQGVIDKVGKVGEALMKPIGMVDRFVIKRLFGACQVEVAKNGGAKMGTEENKIAAGELLTKVILETQQNSIETERSGAMRSDSEFLKGAHMFGSDSMKQIGRLIDAIGEVLVIQKQLKNGLFTGEERSALTKRLKDAKRRAWRAFSVMLTQAIFMAAVAWLFRQLYRRDKDKDVEEQVTDVALDTLGNMLAGLPLLDDLYSFVTDGYEMNNFIYGTINDVMYATKTSMDLAYSAINGKNVTDQEMASALRKIVYAGGQLFGIPARNIFNVVSGVTGLISPSAGYVIDSTFYKSNYNADLAKAIENDDEKLIATIAGLIVDEHIGTEDKATREALRKLTEQGYSVLPKSLGDTLTYDGEEIELSASQKKQFRKIYSVSDQAVASLVKQKNFQKASPEEQAKAVRFIYDTYYNLAVDDLLSVDSEKKNILFAEAIDIEKLALIVSVARGLTADIDKDGKTVAGSRKQKVVAYVESLHLSAAQKYMIMGYLGYTNLKGKAQVKAYINRLNLSSAEKKLLLEYSGYKD